LLFRDFTTSRLPQLLTMWLPVCTSSVGGIQSTSGDVGSGLLMLLKHSLVESFHCLLSGFRAELNPVRFPLSMAIRYININLFGAFT
jgi:hypothetical protein